MSIPATEIYESATPELRTAFEAEAGRSGRPLFEVVDERSDMPIPEVGRLVLEWPIIALSSGATVALARDTIRVNLTRSLRERIVDYETRAGFTFKGKVGVAALGIEPQEYEVTFRLLEFNGEPVVRRLTPLLIRQEPTQIIVNVPEQPPPTVNVNIEQTDPVPERVDFVRGPGGLIKSATIEPI